MTLENTLRTKVAEPAAAGRQSVAFDHDGWTVTLDVERGDTLGCLLWAVNLHRDAGAAAGGAAGGDARAWADRVAAKVSGLMESLRVVEVDSTSNQALLRSDTPTAREAGVQYFELRLTGTSAATLRRVHGHPRTGEACQQVTFALTYEILAKLVGDITG